MSAKIPAGPLCTRSSLANELRDLGVGHGDVLLVHSSLSSIGWVNGGAEAVVLALLDAIGPTGTLVVPTHSGDNSDPAKWANPPVPEGWWDTIRTTMPAYNRQTTRSRAMGVIAETVRTWPGAVRSAHPQTSFAAVGPRASALVDGHSLHCSLGEQSPLARLEESRARVLLLGVGFDSCTAFHLAEYRLPRTPQTDIKNSFAVMTPEGHKWMTVRDIGVSEKDFDEMGADFEKDQHVTRGKLGAAGVRLFSLRDAVEYAEEWLFTHRFSPSMGFACSWRNSRQS
jgi:aminoglycoside 3-N-acetyltransferase